MKPRSLIRATSLFCLLVLASLSLHIFSSSSNSSAQVGLKTPQTGGTIAPTAGTTASPSASAALDKLKGTGGAGSQVTATVSRVTGVYSFVQAGGAGVLAADNPLASPESRARTFLAANGALVGMSDTERNLVKTPGSTATAASTLLASKVATDSLGMTHVRFAQTYQGLKVFGAELVVHMNAQGVKGVNGNFVPGVKVGKTPKVSAAQARRTALSVVTKTPDEHLSVVKSDLAVYRMGLLEGYKGKSVLAYAVEVSGPQTREQVWVNAQTGNVIIRVPLRTDALHRIVYSPTYDPASPDSNKIREEGDPTILPAPSNPPDNLYHYTGHSYNLFSSAFGRDSYDGLGKTMRTVLLVNEACPNAYWDSAATNYCPDFDKDDIVAHEWGHAYTEYTHGLIYVYQSGALNESYSDIFGEAIDLHNNVDGAGGTNNAQPTVYTIQNGQYTPTGGGVRWRIGEDLTGLSQPAALGISRDMLTPEAFQDPSKVTSDLYYCGTDQSTAVHTNSAVPNKAFALLVDGGTYNGQTIQGVGFTRALHIYYRAMTVYQVPSTNFPEHEQALQASCRDLINTPLNNFSALLPVGTPSTDVITSATCQQVAAAAAAVEMSAPPAQCNYKKILDPNEPEACDGSNTIFTEDWETGADGWTVGTQGTGDAWPATNWALKSDLPTNLDGSAHTGTALFAANPKQGEPNGGTCAVGGDVSGHFWADSPEITVPAGASDLKLAFEHFVQTEVDWDGGNVKISVNGGAFNPVPQDQFVFNAPNFAAPDGNPLSGQQIWNGTNQGELVGSWGTTIVNLSNLTSPGDKVRVRFDFGQDPCNGNLGWFVDDVRVYNCPVLDAPTLTVGDDYGNPDKDGRFTLNWTRPAGATGPDVVQESTSCGPVFADDAQEQLSPGPAASTNSKWTGNSQWTSQPNPGDASTAYYIPDAALQNSSLTMKGSIAIPAGASSTLTFTTRQGLDDGFDFGYVEVSADGGATFIPVAAYTGPEGSIVPTTVFEGTRTISLSQFGGQSIKLRFRVTSDEFNVGQPRAGTSITSRSRRATSRPWRRASQALRTSSRTSPTATSATASARPTRSARSWRRALTATSSM